jgi:serine/threonine-protein kinase
MSPEQAEGYEVDFRTDIFSLGIVLWELLAQDRLFVSNNEINTLKKIRECHVPSLRKLDPNIPQELERITNKALARDRTLRYQSAEEFAQYLQIFLNKHYPEFTVKDLSQNLKTIFNDEREDSRKKMIEYAKVQFPPMDEKTEYVSETTNTVTETDASGNKLFKNAHRPPQDEREDGHPANFTNATESKKLNIDLASRNIDNFNLQFDRVELVHASKKRQRHSGNQNTSSKINNIHPSFHTQGSYHHTNPLLARKRKSRMTKYVAYALVVIGIGYYFYLNPTKYDKVAKYADQLINGGVDETESTEVASKSSDQNTNLTAEVPFFNLLVTSVPSGALIVVDDKPTGVYTPGQIRVPVNKAYALRLEKDGFLDETKSLMTIKQGDELRVTLRKRETAYINVSVSGGPAAIYLNGKKISDISPIIRFPVTANVSLKVQAYNPALKKYAEKQVDLEPGTTTQIHLNLADRIPSSKK